MMITLLGLQALGSPPPRPPPPMMHHQQPPPPQQQMFPQMMMDQAAAQGFGLKGESARTKEALARMVNNRLHGRVSSTQWLTQFSLFVMAFLH